MNPYGVELLLDLKSCDLADVSTRRLTEFFVKLCEVIGMTRYGEPLLWEDHSNEPHLNGTSGVQFITTSNVVCHALPLLGAVYVNVFSCREFDPEVAKQFSVDFWQAKSATSTFVTRT
jgi:S-adenosylmethionine/arginine decarboxylase-like enzyme